MADDDATLASDAAATFVRLIMEFLIQRGVIQREDFAAFVHEQIKLALEAPSQGPASKIVSPRDAVLVARLIAVAPAAEEPNGPPK